MRLRSKHSALHARAEQLIPWLANGTLAREAEAAVRQHIAACPQCREDYEEQMRVRDSIRAEGPLVFAAESSYQKLLARLRTPGAADETDHTASRRVLDAGGKRWQARYAFSHAPPAVRWLTAAVLLEALALGLSAWAWHTQTVPHAAPYMTLTSPPPSYDTGARVRVVFRANLTLASLQRVLRGVDAQLIEGPTEEDVYTLGFAPRPDSRAALERRIATLRADPAVLFAEPVADGVR